MSQVTTSSHLAKFIATAFILAALICTDIIVTIQGSSGARERGILIITAQGRIEAKLDDILASTLRSEDKLNTLSGRVK